MSQMTAARPALRHGPGRTAVREPLRVVHGDKVAARGWFPAMCASLLIAGLISVLLLHTALAKGSFELADLQARSSVLADRQEDLTYQVNSYQAPARLAERAADLGMVPVESAAFLRLSDGRVLGVAAPAEKPAKEATAADGPSADTPTGPGPAASHAG